MTEINFYHLQKHPLEKSYIKLLEKIYNTGQRSVVLMRTEEQLKELNHQLWTYSPSSFLPHGSAQEGFEKDQPIWLTTKLENPNESSVLVVLEGDKVNNLNSFKKCLDLFNGNDKVAVIKARERWQDYQKENHKVLYWHQDDNGSWSRKEEMT